MKRAFLILFLVLGAALAGCSDDDDGNGTPSGGSDTGGANSGGSVSTFFYVA